MKDPIKMTPGDDLHLTMLMAPHSLNLAVGQFREQLLGYGRAAFEAGKAGQCLRQIQEPAPATAMDALREAEAALEVAMARILKADPSHSICVTSEAKALVAVRAALAAPAPMLVAQPQLHAALFAARGALQHMKEGGKPTQSLLNEAIAAIDSVAVTQAAPAAVAVPDAVIAGALFDFCGYLTTLPKESAITASGAHDASPMVDAIKAWSAKRSLELDDADVPGWRAALSATPAADAPLPLLVRDIARELGITCAEACLALKPLGNFSTNTAVTAEMMAKLRERFPERVPASEVAGARERMTAGRACYFMERFLKEEKLLGPNEQAALHYVIDMLEAAAAPVVLPEPDDSEFEQQLPIQPIGVMGGGEARKVLWNCTFMPEAGTSFYTEQQVRALLATGGQAQELADTVQTVFDALQDKIDARGPISKGNLQYYVNLLREAFDAAPLAQADARDAEIERAVLAERERICAAIKAEDDHCVTEGDYMLDSDDCIKVARGEWVRPVYDAAIAAAKGQ